MGYKWLLQVTASVHSQGGWKYSQIGRYPVFTTPAHSRPFSVHVEIVLIPPCFFFNSTVYKCVGSQGSYCPFNTLFSSVQQIVKKFTMCQALCYMPDIHGEKDRASDPALPRGLAEPDGGCWRDRPGNPTPGQVSRPLENSVWLPLRSLSLNSFICKMGAAAPPSAHRVALGF